MSGSRARFNVGDCIQHRLFEYRGVIADVDATFQGSDEWYEGVARSRPPKDAPWYHVLPHGQMHTTYVAERNLELDDTGEPVNHPLVGRLFVRSDDGRYIRRQSLN